jgi:glycosyltransferase involved in cell wall biosynthesis
MGDRGSREDQGLDGRTILHVIPALVEDRVARTVLAIAEAAAAAGARLIVAAEKGPLVGDLQAAGGEWIAFDLGGWSPVAAIGNVAHLRGLFDREAVDIVHVHAHARLAAFSGLMAGRLARIVGISPGLDLRRFSPDRVSARERAEFRAVAGLAGPERVVVHQARFHPDKGQEVLIDAARLLVNGGLSGTVFLIVCDGPDDPDYRVRLGARIEAQGLDGVVHLVAASEAGPAALASAHVAIASSLAPDPVGRAAAEAMAMGVPVVASDIGALVDLIRAPPGTPEDERTGFRAAPGDAMALAEAIGRAIELDPRSRLAMVGRAAAHARRFTRQRLQDQTVAIYRRVLAAAR